MAQSVTCDRVKLFYTKVYGQCYKNLELWGDKMAVCETSTSCCSSLRLGLVRSNSSKFA